MSEPQEYFGHLTKEDGTHVPLGKAQAESLWRMTEEATKNRATAMPDEQSAIKAMFEAHERLRELGWRDICYAPKDGTPFKVIENGSTGIFDCSYFGRWPDGHFMVYCSGDIYPQRTGLALFKPTEQTPNPAHVLRTD